MLSPDGFKRVLHSTYSWIIKIAPFLTSPCPKNSILLVSQSSVTWLPLYLENRENQSKTGNLKNDQKSHWIWKMTKKSGNFIKFTDWQLPIEQTSRQCWKQNVGNSGLAMDGVITRNSWITYFSIYSNPRIVHLIIAVFCNL